MTAAARAISSPPVLRTASGEPPLGHEGAAFRADQGLMFEPDNAAYRSLATRIGVLELHNGKWLAFPFGIDRPQYESREDALRSGIAALVRKARRYMCNLEGQGTHWTEGYAGRVIEWALSLKPETDLVHRDALAASAVIIQPGELPDAAPKANPYLITGPAMISFSGGRTSGYMLRQIIEAHGGTLPDDVKVVFANTGKEREETLQFVNRCAFHWKIKIHWVEWISEKPGFREVNFDTAARAGEPFAALIAKKQMPPNWQARFCTQFLKVKAMTAFALSLGWAECSYKEVIGLRDDEGIRILKMMARNEKDGRQCVIPLAKAKIVKADVMAFWKARSFDLDLPDGEGNCDLCFLKSKRLRMKLAADRPKSVEWWSEQEALTNGFFDRRTRYAALLGAPSPAATDEPGPEEYDAECDLACAPDDEGEAITEVGVTDDGCRGRDGEVSQSTAEITAADYVEQIDRISSETDPIVRELCELKRARKLYPAGHTFAMTNPIINGSMVTLGSCTCGDSFSYSWGSYERMDAAIEAHWQKFDASPDKVDGRGQAITADGEVIEAPKAAKPKRKTKSKNSDGGVESQTRKELSADEQSLIAAGNVNSLGVAPGPSEHQPGAHGQPAPLEPAPSPQMPPDGAGSPHTEQPAQICAGSSEVSGPSGLTGLTRPSGEADPVREAGLHGGSLAIDDDDLAIEWPSYDAFLDQKIVTAPMRGIEVARDALHPWLKPHCKDLTVWALRLGCAAIFANFGLHKTAMQLEWCRQLAKHTGQPTLNIVPLGVRHGFIKEALQLGMDVRFIRTTAELDDLYCEGVRHFLTNYESARDGKLDPNQFEAVSLDEASVLRSYGSKTFQEFLPLFSKVPYKLVATATPSPNRYKELIHYAGFLGVMDTGLALTRWFQRNSEKAGDLTLYLHKEDEFWMWVHSWAAFLQRPSELGYSDEGYELPPLKLRWHEVPADHTKAEPERDGQGVMFRAVANSLQEAAKSRRDSLAPRIAKMSEIIAADPNAHRIIWHDLEAEREAIEQALPEVVTISGSMDIDAREVRLHDFEEGRTKYFGTKPILSGSGSNFQYHCHKAIYVALPGYGYKFNDFIQSLYRLQRFGQQHPVEVDIIYSEDERSGRAALEEKWARDIEMRDRMSEVIKKHGLDNLPMRDAMARSIGVKRVEIKGERFTAINNDAVAETRTWPENSVDEIITSIPFSNHYEYSASYNDFGHTDDNGHFWGQMDFLTAELLRMLKPGRLACIHVKDRILFGSVTGEGVPTISPFHAEAIMHYRAHGFQYMGMITVVTDVVRENNQTYRLGWSENCKDGTKMGVGSPEYVLLLRKPQSDKTKGYADVPVTKTKMESAGLNLEGEGQGEGYSRARWQIDAHALWRSSGNRMLTPEEFSACSSADLAKLFAKTTVDRVYDYEAHVRIGEAHERTGTLPATFMAIAPGSHDPDVWHDINRMRTLNMLQQRKGAEMHLCPLQFDIVDRLIERYSNEGDLIFDPFGGLMTVPYRALLKGRRGAATELNAGYFLDGVHYLRMAEEKMTTPALFDLAGFEASDTPPRK